MTHWFLAKEIKSFSTSIRIRLSYGHRVLPLSQHVTLHQRCFSCDPDQPSTSVSERTRCWSLHTSTSSLLLLHRPLPMTNRHCLLSNYAIATWHVHWAGMDDGARSSTSVSDRRCFQLEEKTRVNRIPFAVGGNIPHCASLFTRKYPGKHGPGRWRRFGSI